MFVGLQEHRHGMDRLPPPSSLSQARNDDVPRVLPSLSSSSFGYDDRMDVDVRYDSKQQPPSTGQRHEVEVATTLASMATFNLKSPTLPSPTQSFSSVKSEDMTRSTNSQFSSPEPRSPDLLPSVSSQLSFTSKDGSFSSSSANAQITLPRLRELDLRLPDPEFAPQPPNSATFMTPLTGPRRTSLESINSFPESRIDIPSPTAYRMPIPPMAYPDALPSPTSQHQHQHHRHPLSPPIVGRRLTNRLPVTLRTGGSSPSHRTRRSPTGSRCNVKYTIQQVDFIDYFRVDHHLSWKEVEAKYASVFPEDAAKGHKRGPQGLQGVYYRKNKQIPATDQNNLFIFDEDDNPRTFQCDVREQGKKMNNSIGLLAMHPERAITYSWVSEEHKKQYEKVGRARQAQLDAAEQRKKRRRAIQNSRL